MKRLQNNVNNISTKGRCELILALNEVDRWRKWIGEEKERLSQEWRESKAIQHQSMEAVHIAQSQVVCCEKKLVKANAIIKRMSRRESRRKMNTDGFNPK